ncbi:FUN14 family protein [Colletotrichum zoysiae]|uniref:FUN14 family protein n=1 Tax=Colletotrichum zoysiae TaxID=1216348 RepID=A0AAD9LVN6_9PEZI|nr:FUN14 family protein [Colletotrichum zoysiae]
MSGLLSARLAGRRLVLPVGSGICVAYSLHCRQTPNYLNSHFTSSVSPTPRAQSRSFGGLSPDAMRQLSSGTLSGFGAGLLVGFLSHTLVLLTGLVMFTFYLAHRYGLDLPRLLGVRERLNKAVLTRPFHNVVFRLSFAATFTLAAFVRF